MIRRATAEDRRLMRWRPVLTKAERLERVAVAMREKAVRERAERLKVTAEIMRQRKAFNSYQWPRWNNRAHWQRRRAEYLREVGRTEKQAS